MKHISRDNIRRYRASGRERLHHLASFLDEVPRGMLTFTRWYGQGRGCAVGLAAHESVWMQAQGLHLEASPEGRISHPVFGDLSDWPAVAAFFDVPIEVAQDLFSTRGYAGNVRPDPRTVAGKIRTYMATQALEAA